MNDRLPFIIILAINGCHSALADRSCRLSGVGLSMSQAIKGKLTLLVRCGDAVCGARNPDSHGENYYYGGARVVNNLLAWQRIS